MVQRVFLKIKTDERVPVLVFPPSELFRISFALESDYFLCRSLDLPPSLL